MQKTTVKIIKLINGDDIVTVLPTGDKQLPDNGPLIRLDKPLQIKYVPQMTPLGFRDYIAMIRWTNYTSDKIVTIPKDKIMTITNASLEMSTSYSEIVKNYDKLDKPLQIKYVPQMTPLGFRDYIAMIRWTNYTNDKIVTIPKDKIMTITNASLEMAGSYGEIVKNYDKLDKPKRDEKYTQKEFSPEENKKLNEIFRELDDEEEEPTLH